MLLGLSPPRACCKAMARKAAGVGRGEQSCSLQNKKNRESEGGGEKQRGKRIETIKEEKEILADGGMCLDSQHS